MKLLPFCLLLILQLINPTAKYGQQISFCGFDQVQKDIFERNPEFLIKTQQFEEKILRQEQLNGAFRNEVNYILPVVVHIIHENGSENISDDGVINGIANLNEAFANLGYYDQETGVKTGIQFCLAERDPDGVQTKGINRILSSLTNMVISQDNEAVKNLSIWDPANYINVWLVKEICTEDNCGVIGYSSFPAHHGTSNDGIVVEASYFAGSKGESAVQVHEMGHYLGLYHTFQDGCKNDDCKIDGDKVCDTPPDASTFPIDCENTMNTCSTDVNSGFSEDQEDMFWNYMDYGDLDCYSAFTAGQRNRMIQTIELVRFSLLNSKACLSPCDGPDEITALFDLPLDTFYLGEAVTIHNSSSSNAVEFTWSFNGNPISSNYDFQYVFQEIETKILSLEAKGEDGICVDQFSRKIEIICPSKAHIQVDKTSILSGETLVFESDGSEENKYGWYIDDEAQSTESNFDHTFYDEGTYEVKLVSTSKIWECSDTASILITVTCPVKSFFETQEFFPLINTVVNFSNKSMNSNYYFWTIDGKEVSNSVDFNHVFNQSGVYSICLIAKNEFCENQYCMDLFVLDSLELECEKTLAKTFGLEQTNERCYHFEFTDKDEMIVAGSQDDKSLLFSLDKEGKVQKTHLFNFVSGDEYICRFIIDDEGYLLISGVETNYSNGREAFILKYDIANEQVLWLKKVNDPNVSHPVFWHLEQGASGNYLIGGQTDEIGCDALIMEIDKTNGDIIWEKSFTTGSCETFTKLITIGDYIYGIGRFAIYSASPDKFRPILMKMDKTGNVVWTKNLVFPISGSSRIYANDIIDDNGFVIVNLGDEEGMDLERSKMQVIKTDYDGNIVFAKGFYVEGTAYNRLVKMLNFPDGYLVFGSYKYEGDNRKLLIMKLNKSGELVWSKSYQMGKSTVGDHILYRSGYIYVLGTVTDVNGDDIFYLKLDIEGDLTEECPGIVENIDIERSELSRISEDIEAELIDNPLPYSNTIYDREQATLAEKLICKKECLDSCDLVPDAIITIDDLTCSQNGVLIHFEICNSGNSVLSMNTPVSFYNGDPIEINAGLIDVFVIPDSIVPGECINYQFLIDTFPQKIIGFVNDAGSNTTPFIPESDMPNSGIFECVWDNNIAIATLQNIKDPQLDLGADTLICVSGIITLEAGEDYFSYLWQDGSNESIYTAWEPGVYWVEVTDYCGNSQSDTINIELDRKTIVELGDIIKVCEGDTVVLKIDDFENYKWEPAEFIHCGSDCSQVSIIPDSSLMVTVTVENENGCFSEDSVFIEVNYPVDFELPPDTTIQLGDEIQIIPEIESTESKLEFSWIPSESISCDKCEYIVAVPEQSTIYQLTITTEYGCINSDEILINLSKELNIYLPNIFSPNNDGYNDVFAPIGNLKGIAQIKLSVFDRWGELIFHSQQTAQEKEMQGWDGTFKGVDVNPGVYIYLIEFNLIDGTDFYRSGDVTLIR